MKSPWEEKWEILEQLDKTTGQGTTYRVRNISEPSQMGVLKVLKNQRSPQARGRMRREVVNLDVLAKAGVKVPRVLDGNTEQYGDPSITLYFVMEHIEGRTLAQEVTTRGKLTLEDAVGVALDLCNTVAAAHSSDVLHRDLKPDNVVARSLRDLVIVDYGLSFNEAEDSNDQLTQTDEQFRNRFLDLPENYAVGGNRRDKRSDLTAICGIFYYCLTGQRPGPLRDANNRPPHRRQGVSVSDVLRSDSRCHHVELLMDRGFAQEVEFRYQSCKELTTRLEGILGSPGLSDEDPLAVARELGALLRQNDRPTQIAQYQQVTAEILQEMLQAVLHKQQPDMAPFSVGFGIGAGVDRAYPSEIDRLGPAMTMTVTLHPHQHTRQVVFAFGAKGRQIVLLRLIAGKRAEAHDFVFREWEELVHFDPERRPAVESLARFLEMSIGPMIKELYAEAQARG